MERTKHTFLGLDLGQRSDHSALAILDLVESIGSTRDPVTFAFLTRRQLLLRGLVRFPLGTPYTAIPGKVRHAIMQVPSGPWDVRPRSTLAVDAGGPGLPVVEMLRNANLPAGLLPAIITGANAGSRLPGSIYSVPRKELITLLRLSLESRMLVFPNDLPMKEQLINELASIESAGGQRKHDDMAIAIALALWATTKRQPGLIQHQAA